MKRTTRTARVSMDLRLTVAWVAQIHHPQTAGPQHHRATDYSPLRILHRVASSDLGLISSTRSPSIRSRRAATGSGAAHEGLIAPRPGRAAAWVGCPPFACVPSRLGHDGTDCAAESICCRKGRSRQVFLHGLARNAHMSWAQVIEVADS